jgi:hypothetical protein
MANFDVRHEGVSLRIVEYTFAGFYAKLPISEAHEVAEDTRGSVLAFVGGFVLFILVSAGLKGGGS